MASWNRYTPEQEEYLRTHAYGISRAQLTDDFNRKFGTNKSVLSIKSWCNTRGLNSGNTGRFENGNKSWQTGLHGDDYWAHFSDKSKAKVKASLDASRQKYKVGDTVIRHGCPAFYVSDSGKLDDRIVYASTAVWESAHGKLPDDMLIIHLNGDAMDYSLDNLQAIPRRWLPNIRYVGGLTDNKELNITKLKYCELMDVVR